MTNTTTDQTFVEDVLKSDQPVLVDFWAPWCGPCLMLAPTLEKVGQDLDGKAKVYKLNVDENPATAQYFGISGIPTVIAFKDGKVQKKLVGLQPEANYVAALN